MSKKPLSRRLVSKQLIKDKLTLLQLALQLFLAIAVIWINLGSLSSSTLLIETRYSNTLNGGGLIDPKDWRAGGVPSLAASLVMLTGIFVASFLHRVDRPVFARLFLLINLILLAFLLIVVISYSQALGN